MSRVTEEQFVRGVEDVVDFAQAQLEVLNNPKNRIKLHWSETVLEDVVDKLAEEWNELIVELECIAASGGDLTGYRAVMAEAVDLANMAMMVWAKARTEVEHLEAQLENERTLQGVTYGV